MTLIVTPCEGRSRADKPFDRPVIHRSKSLPNLGIAMGLSPSDFKKLMELENRNYGGGKIQVSAGPSRYYHPILGGWASIEPERRR